MLNVNKKFGLDDFETGLGRIADGEAVLRIPNKIKTDVVGGVISLLQLIITWYRKYEEEAVLRVFAENIEDKALENFAKTPFGLTALNMAGSIKSNNNENISRAMAMELSRSFVVSMHDSLLRRIDNGKVIPIICLDNSKQYSRPNRLYQPGTDIVRGRLEMQDLLSSCADAIVPENRRTYYDKNIINSAASLLFEAFQNTHEHAQATFVGDRIRRSVRGVLISYKYIDRDHIRGAFDGYAPMRRYFQIWRPDHPIAQHAQFLEIAIFDSGSGLAQTWLGKLGSLKDGIVADKIPLNIEFDAVLQCLRKGRTTTYDRSRGNGLYRVMHAVKRSGGFIRIRTGRLSLIRTFDGGSDDPLTDSETDVVDMHTGGTPEKAESWADGTVISVMLPLNKELVA